MKVLAVLFVFVLCIDCGKKDILPKYGIVAHVGDYAITARDFRLNYEFGFAQLKNSPNKKASYLEYMINETLLSIEGYRLGLDKTDRVQKLEKALLENLLVEELFRIEVDKKIEITPENVKQAINKSKVKWKLKYWGVTDSFTEKHDNSFQADYGKDTHHSKEYETDYLTWLDIPPDLLKTIENLKIGEISDPIEINDAYFLFQVSDLQRGGISNYDYQNTYKRFEQILFYRQLEEKTASYISDFITQKNIITNGNALKILAFGLAEWKQNENNKDTFSEAIANANETGTSLWRLKNQLDDILITFDNGQVLIKDIVKMFDPASIAADPSVRALFHNKFKKQIALTIRNHFFVKEAIEKGLHKSPAVVNQLQAWKDKWVYEEMRHVYMENITVDDSTMKDYFKNKKARYKTLNDYDPAYNDYEDQARQHAYFEKSHLFLEKKIQLLKQENTVHINDEVLDTVSVIDFKKSRWANLFLYNNSGRMTIPIIDPTWGIASIDRMQN